MKAVLKFNLPKEEGDLLKALKAPDMHCLIYELLYDQIRHRLKYNTMSEETARTLEELRNWISQEIIDRQIPGFD